MGFKNKINEMREKKMYYLMITPFFILFLICALIPIGYAFYISFFRWSGVTIESTFVGLDNYVNMFLDPLFWKCAQNTIIFTACFLLLSTALSLMLALALNKIMRGTVLFRTMSFIPYVTSSAVIAIVWRLMFDHAYGVLNLVLQSMGLPRVLWLSKEMALYSCLLVSVWQNLGYYTVILLAGLQTIPDVYYDAARVDGAGEGVILRKITLPLLKPTLFMVIALETLHSFFVYDIIYTLTQGGPGYASTTLMYYLYRRGFINFYFGYASAIGIFLAAISFLVVMFQKRYIGRPTAQF